MPAPDPAAEVLDDVRMRPLGQCLQDKYLFKQLMPALVAWRQILPWVVASGTGALDEDGGTLPGLGRNGDLRVGRDPGVDVLVGNCVESGTNSSNVRSSYSLSEVPM